MKRYEQPKASAIQLVLCDLILTSAEEPALDLGDVNGGETAWNEAWNAGLWG